MKPIDPEEIEAKKTQFLVALYELVRDDTNRRDPSADTLLHCGFPPETIGEKAKVHETLVDRIRGELSRAGLIRHFGGNRYNLTEAGRRVAEAWLFAKTLKGRFRRGRRAVVGMIASAPGTIAGWVGRILGIKP